MLGNPIHVFGCRINNTATELCKLLIGKMGKTSPMNSPFGPFRHFPISLFRCCTDKTVARKAFGAFVICMILAPAPVAAATDVAPQIIISSEGRISADIENVSLQEVVRLMVEKQVLKIRGSLPQGVLNPSRFFELAPEQALIKLLRGFNYAISREHLTDKWTMMVLGQAKREPYKAEEKPAQRLDPGGRGPEKTRFRPYSASIPPPGSSPASELGTGKAKDGLSLEKDESGSIAPVLQDQQKPLEQGTNSGAGAKVSPKRDDGATKAAKNSVPEANQSP
jgi:hypothetical protein